LQEKPCNGCKNLKVWAENSAKKCEFFLNGNNKTKLFTEATPVSSTWARFEEEEEEFSIANLVTHFSSKRFLDFDLPVVVV